jgi:hypothetical protein
MMQHENISEAEIDGWLNTLGVASLCQWDVLIFLYRHQTSLLGADFIARLLGYASGPVAAALDVLESLGLVARSRVSQIVRLYQFTVPSDPQRGEAWARVLTLASDHAGRLLLSKSLRDSDRTDQQRLRASQLFLAEAKQHLEATRQHLEATRQRWQTRRGGRGTWLKAI